MMDENEQRLMDAKDEQIRGYEKTLAQQAKLTKQLKMENAMLWNLLWVMKQGVDAGD